MHDDTALIRRQLDRLADAVDLCHRLMAHNAESVARAHRLRDEAVRAIDRAHATRKAVAASWAEWQHAQKDRT